MLDHDGQNAECPAGQAKVQTRRLKLTGWYIPLYSVVAVAEGYAQGIQTEFAFTC